MARARVRSGGPAKGPGWGGPAKGEGKHNPPGPLLTGPGPGAGYKAWSTMQREERLQTLQERMYEIGMAKPAEEAMPVQIQALSKLHDIEQPPTTRSEFTGKDGGPIETKDTRFSDAEDIVAKRRSAAAASGTDADS